jgi:hypothetical protein
VVTPRVEIPQQDVIIEAPQIVAPTIQKTPEPAPLKYLDPRVVDSVGVRPHSRVEDAPVVINENAGPSGTGKIMEIRQTVKTENLAQPFLNKEEAEALGVCKWKLFSRTVKGLDNKKIAPNRLFTTIVNGRRFLITRGVHESIAHD